MPINLNVFNSNNGNEPSSKEKAGIALKAAKTVGKIAGFGGKNTITQMAKNNILQYPVIMSAGVDIDDATVIARALERQFATLFVVAWSSNDNRLKDGETLSDKINKEYHNNKDIPNLIKNGADLINGIRADGNIATNVMSMMESNVSISKDSIMECWATIEDSINMKSINECYLPNKKVINKMESVLEAGGKGKDSSSSNTPHTTHIDVTGDNIHTQINPQGDNVRDKYAGDNVETKVETGGGDYIASQKITNTDYSTYKQMDNKGGAMIREGKDKLSALEPLIVEVDYVYNADNQAPILRKGLVGIKTMIRLVSPDIMIANVIKSIESSDLAFKFVKWTRGEYKLADMLFGTRQAREDARDRRTASRWFKALKKRKGFGRFIRRKNLSPITTLVLTAYEVQVIGEKMHIDLSNPKFAKRLIDSLYLLGLIIYDKDTKVVSAMFDGDDGFNDVSISGLKADNKKDTDFANLKEMAKLFGKL